MNTNYCQNLWAQFAKINVAQQNCVAILRSANIEGAADFQIVRKTVADLELELDGMQEIWDGSFEPVSGGRKLFGPQFEAMRRIAEEQDSTVESLLHSLHSTISEEGFMIELDFRPSYSGLPSLKTEPLSQFYSLKKLILGDCKIDSPVPFGQLRNLEILHIGGTGTTDLAFLDSLSNLKSLDISHCPINDTSPLGRQTKLENLSFIGTGVYDFEFLRHMSGLKSIGLFRSGFKDASVFEGLVNLEQIGLNGNQVVDIGPLSHLTNLKRLELNSTRVEDLTPLMELPALESIDIYSSPACRDPKQKELIRKLQEKGVRVHAPNN